MAGGGKNNGGGGMGQFGKAMIGGAALIVLGAVGAGAYLALQPQNELALDGRTIDMRHKPLGGDFSVTTHTGETVDANGVLDGPTLVYFGYTFCPDVCPIDALRMADVQRLLADDGVDIDTVFVTIDPARDTPEAISYFVDAMHPEMLGLVPDQPTLEAMTADWGLYFNKVNAPDSEPDDYLMSHTNFIYFVGADARSRFLFRGEQTIESIAADVKTIISAGYGDPSS
ncbi:MAG: SCO family protein [Pseudomonadota bacterium]